MRRKLESDKRAELQNALDTIFGPRSSIVAVSAEFNTDAENENKTEVDSWRGRLPKPANETIWTGAGNVNGAIAPGAGANVERPADPAAAAEPRERPTYGRHH